MIFLTRYTSPTVASHHSPFSYRTPSYPCGAPSWLTQPYRGDVYLYRVPQKEADTDKGEESKEEANKERSPTVPILHGRDFQISDDGSNYAISLDLPGVQSSDAKVELLDNGILQVEAERTTGKKRKFHRQFAFDEGNVDSTNISANLVDGVLSIEVPKKEPARPAEPVELTIQAGYAPQEDEDKHKTLIWTTDMPGVKVEGVKVVFRHEGLLAVQGERRRGELTVSKFRRSFEVDPKILDTTKLQAFLADGVLTVIAPKREPVPPKSIAINATAQVPEETEQKKLLQDEDFVNVETISEEEASADEASDSESAASKKSGNGE